MQISLFNLAGSSSDKLRSMHCYQTTPKIVERKLIGYYRRVYRNPNQLFLKNFLKESAADDKQIPFLRELLFTEASLSYLALTRSFRIPSEIL